MRYEDIDAVNFSTLKHARTSLKHYQHALQNPTPETDLMRKGSAVHAAVFEPDRFLTDFVAWTRRTKAGKSAPRSGKAWDEFREEHSHQTILTIDQMARATAIGEAVHANPVAREILRAGIAEKPILWTDPITSLKCKARPDWVADDGDVADLKVTGRGISAWAFANSMQLMGYYLQIAFYCLGLDIVHGGGTFTPVFICVEDKPPHDVAVHELGAQSLDVANAELDELLEAVARAKKTGEYPGQYERRNILDLPKWRLDTETTDIGDLELEY